MKGYSVVLRKYIPRLSEIKIGFNQVPIVYKDAEGWWVVRMPRALYPIRYVKWTSAIRFASEAGAVIYSGSELTNPDDHNEIQDIVINKKYV